MQLSRATLNSTNAINAETMLHKINIAQYMRNYSIEHRYQNKSTIWNTYMKVEIIHASGRPNNK